MHDVADTCFDGGVDECLALGQHGDGIAGQEVDPIHSVQRVGEGARVVQVEAHRVPACCAQFVHLPETAVPRENKPTLAMKIVRSWNRCMMYPVVGMITAR